MFLFFLVTETLHEKKLLIRRKNAREKRKRRFSKIESTMPTNLLFQVNVPFLYILKTSGCIERKHCLKWVKILH